MAYQSGKRPTFFEVFKAHCSGSDLGPISLDWFEELSSEAPPYEPKLLREPESPIGWFDQTFKTPKAKSCTDSQLASTPLIFKEQNTMPPFSSPGRDLDQKKMETSREDLLSPGMAGRKTDEESQILASPHGICHNDTAASLTILRNTCRTPRKSNIPGPYGSLFCTPKFLEIRTPKRISESLGAEVDPEMSWSSSLATPPTLGATVLIARENDSISGAKQQDEKAEIVLRNIFPKDDEYTAKNDTSLLSIPERVKLNDKDDIKDLESEMLDGFFGETNSFEDSFNFPAESSGTLLLLPHALDAIEKCEIKTDETQGKGDVLSEQLMRRKTAISQEVKAANWTAKSCCVEVKDSVFQNTDEDIVDSKDSCLVGHEKELEYLRIAGNLQDNRTQKSSVNEKLVKDVLSSSSQWSQLNLSDLDVTHLEMSICSSPQSDLCRKKGIEEKSALMTEDDAVEMSLLNTSGLINAQELSSANLTENCSDMKISANIRTTSEITPVKPVCASPKLVKGCATEEVSKMSFLNCSSFLVESTNVMEYSVVYNSTFSTRLKATSKSVVTDVLSHPFICSAASPDSCSDLHLTNSENALRKSSFKSLNMLSRLRKKSKRFIYTINNTLVYRKENVQKEVTSEARANSVLTHLESDSCEFKSCQVATDANQDCLLSAEKQSNIKENNFKTSTVEVDIMDNSSEDSVNSRLKQQELSDSGKNAGERQPATSFKCLEASRTRSEDTTDCLNSGRISNIKQKVLTSACLMARRHSRLFPEDCCLRKGKNDAYISPSVNSRAAIPRSPKGQPPQSSPSSTDCLSDMDHGMAFVTNSKFSNTLSQVKFGMNRVSSNSCNKISADKRHATGQLSAAECREIVAPLGTKCLKNNSTGLKQWGKKDVDENQETPSVKNSENPQADAWNKIPVEIAEEFLDCMGNNSLIEVVSEEDSQVAPGYFNTKPVENLEHKGKSSGDLNARSSSLSFGGFQTASNKQIKFSESSIAKSKMLFKDIENECFEASSIERVRNFSNQVQKENVFSSDLETKTGSALSGSQEGGTVFIPCKVDLCKNLPRNQLSVQEPNQSLTASQEAEIAELSNILEETGSQFEFTQFRKQSNTHSHVQQFGARNVQNASEAGEDADFCSSLKSENHVINDEYCSKLKNENECKIVEYEKEDTVVFHKNNKKVPFTNLDRNGSGMSNHESCPVPFQASFSNFVGFTSAGGKKINISKAALTRSAELFRDLDDNFLFKSSATNSGCCNSDGYVSSNWNFPRCQTKEEDGGILCVPNIRSTGPVSHHSEKNYAENVSTPCEENTENWTEILSDNENVDVSCTDARCSASGMRNSPSSFKNPHQNSRNSDQFLNQEDSQVEGCLQEDSSYLICLGDNITSEEEHGLSVSGEVEHLSPNQKDREQEDEHLLQNCQAADTDAVSISDSSLCSSLRDLNVQCGERDADVSENSSKQTTNSVSVEGEDSSKKNLFVNEGGIGSYQHHQIPSEQETVGEKNEVKGAYLTGFHTASGKKITIADGFLAKAEKFFSENNVDLGKDDSEYFEDCLRKGNKNYVKDCDLCMDSVAQCDVDVLNFKDKLIPEEPGDCLKKTVEGSPIQQAVNHDSIKVGAFINVDEDCKRNLAAPCTNKKAHVRPGNSEVESLPGCGSNSLSRTPLLEDRQLFAERDVECSVKKRDNSERKPDFPLQSATSLHLTEASSDLADNSMPAGIFKTVSAEDSCKSHQSLLLTHSSVPESTSPYLNCGSKEIDLKCLNEPYSNADCFPKTADNAHQEQSEVSLPEDRTNLTCLQKTSPNAENQKSVLKQVFSTAKGKAVSVSESALASIRQMFQTDCDESVKSEIETKSGTNQTENSGNLSFSICAGSPGFATYLDTTKSEMNLAASHFINGNGNLSEKGCQGANTFADADSVLDSEMQCFEQKSKLLGHLPVPDKQMEQSGPSGNLGFFSTASGKPVQLSEESLKKARQLFSEMEGSHSSGLQDALLFEEGVEKSRNRDEIFPREMQLALLRETENAGTDVISSPALGFSTASGKKVTISESAYRKAKAILKESDSFLGNELGVTYELSEMQESGQRAKHLTGKVISESKTEKSCTEDLDLKSIHPEEMKSFPSTHHVEITEYVPHSKRNSQSAPFKNSFDQVETRFFRKGELNLRMKTESLSDLCSATSKAEINFQTPKGYLKTEAAESAKAFMEDDLLDSGVQVKSAQSFIGKMSYNFQNKPFGKRHLEEKDSLGEPPIKRQLLLEFENMKIPPKSSKPLKSTPDGIFKDRRKFMYHVPLKPVTCQPLGTTKERQEVRNPTLTLPDQDLKGFKSIPAVFQHCALRQSSSGASGLFTPHKAAAKEGEETRSLCMSGKAVKTFVPPFKTKLTLSADEQGSTRCHSPVRNNVTKERGLNQIPVEQNSAEAQDHQSCTLHAAVTNLESDNLVMSNMMANLHCARDLQEMRIKKKYRQNISPQPGSLYVIKTSARNRMSLKAAVEEETPSFHSTEKLYTYGVSKHCMQVNSTNAESFQFLIEEFFSKEYLLAGNGIQLADGGWLIPTDEGKAGKKEFYRALCDTPGVDPKLITEAWVYNHYRWIVWKLAAMEVSFPHKFANRCLTPETVLLQLKYRYDLEIDKSKRSAIKKITERDDAAGKTLVLCVSKIQTPNAAVSPSNSNNNTESEKAAAIIEVTDGWYGIRALLDPPLKAFLHRRRLTVGQKIIVHGAELIGSPNGCTPLEAPDSLMLKISANSTRCARWYAKLGFHRDPKPFPLPLSSLYSEGGAVGCIDVVIQRTYPIQWMEKTPSGSYVFRNSRAEEREAAKHAEHQQKKLEALFAKIQAEFEKHEERSCRRTPRSRVVTRQQIHNLQDGAELYEAIQNAPDPSYMEGYLSEDQLKALNAHKQLMNDKKQTLIQEEFKKAVESAEQEKHGCSKRDVSTVWKLFVVDYRKQEKRRGVILSIWRPLLDVCSLLKEGSRYRIYQLSASQSKGRSDLTNVQLSATKKTLYLQLSVSQKILLQIFFPRKALKFTSLLDPSYQPPCAEVDVVGVVISISRTGFTNIVYLSDESCNLVAVKIRADLRHFAIEDIVVRCSFIAASNLQWQSEFRSEIPVLLAGDLSAFSASPKENHLQERFNELRRMIENVDSFCSDAESKLMNLLQRNCSVTPILPKRCGLECFSPSCNSGLYAEDKSSISSKTEMKHQSPLSASTPNTKLFPQGSAVTPSSAVSNENHPRNSKKRKAMDFLSCIPAPPPLTPICSIISPSLKKAFQPPRSLGSRHSKLAKDTNPNTGCVTPSRKLREAVQLPDNDLVADEELAMINTQALINTVPEEKKMDYVNEDSAKATDLSGDTRATYLSGDLSSRNSSRSAKEANGLLKSSSEGADALQKDTEESEGSLSIRRVLQKRKSRKCN